MVLEEKLSSMLQVETQYPSVCTTIPKEETPSSPTTIPDPEPEPVPISPPTQPVICPPLIPERVRKESDFVKVKRHVYDTMKYKALE